VSTTTERAETAYEDLGPVDVIVIGFRPDAPMTGEAIPLLLDLVERGIVRVLDVRFVTKRADGTFAGFDAIDLTPDSVGDFVEFEGATSGLLGDDDVAKVADEIEPGTSAVMIVYENHWAAPFVSAVRRNGGELIASLRIGVEDLVAALDALEATS
jgi:hypothetical protein